MAAAAEKEGGGGSIAPPALFYSPPPTPSCCSHHPPCTPCPLPPRRLRFLVIDLAFVVEAREDEDLPEVLLGSVRLSRMDVNKAPIIAHQPMDWKLGTQEPYGE